MAKIIASADHHIHTWTSFAKMNKDGLNTRMIETMIPLKRMIKIAEEENAEAITVSGDLFHVARFDATMYDLVVRILRTTKIPIIMIPGNHDEASKMEEYHTLRAFNGIGKMIHLLDKREGKCFLTGSLKIAGIPFQNYNQDLKKNLSELKKADVFLLHTGFANAVAGSDFIADQKEFITTESIRKRIDFHVVVAGHFHQPQFYTPTSDRPHVVSSDELDYKMKPGTVLIPGAPLQHNFGDMYSLRGCWVLDLKKNLMRFKGLGLPEFVRADFSEEVDKDYSDWLTSFDGNYVNLTVGTREQYNEWKDVLNEIARGFNLQLKKVQYSKNRISVNLEMGKKKILKSFIKSRRRGEMDEKLLDAGLKILGRAEQELSN